MKKKLVMILTLSTAFLIMLSACSSKTTKIQVGSMNFTESLILGEMYALALEDNDFEVERKLNLDGTFAAHEALKTGDIDVYPEYTGTGLFNIIGIEPPVDPQEVYEIVSEYYKREFNLVWLAPSQINNTQAIAMSRKASEEYDITTLSDLQIEAEHIDFAVVPEFEERVDGLAGMNEVYGEFNFKSIKLFNYRVKYRAVLNDEVQATVAFGTDGELTNPELILLEDDQFLWPPYLATPVIRQETLDKDGQIREILDEISAKLDDQTMRELNAEVDVDQQEYTDVAKEFLKKEGLIE